MLGSFWIYIKKHKRNTFIIVGAILVGIFIIFRPNGAVNVREYKVSRIEVIKNINASGETKADTSNVVKSPVSAKIKKINYHSGSQVSKDDIVLEFDELSLNASYTSSWQAYLAAKATADTYDQQIKAAEASVSDKRYARDAAQRDYNEDDSFDNKQALKTSESAYQSAVSSLNTIKEKQESTKQSVASTYSTFLLASDNYKNSKLKAPNTGFLALENLKIGDSILVGQELYSITNSADLQFVAEVDEADIQSIVLSQPVRVELEGYAEKEFEGFVSTIDAKTSITSSGGNIVETYIEVNFENIKPIIGLTGTAKIQVGKETEQIAVPFDAVTFEGDNNDFVYVIKNGKALKTKVEVGFEGDEYYAIKSGLNEGDLVVTGVDITTIKDGQQISLIKD